MSGIKEEFIERLSATDGLLLKIYDYQTNQFFTGKDLFEKKSFFTYLSKNLEKNFNFNSFIEQYSKDINKNNCDITYLFDVTYLFSKSFLIKFRINNLIQKYLFQNPFNIIKFQNTSLKGITQTPSYLISKKFANDVLNVKEINLAIDILYSKLLFKDKIVNGCFVNSTIFDHPDFEEGVKSSTITALGRSIS